MKDSAIITAAKMLAGEAHKGQMRKYGGLPYIIHPIEVATIVEEAGGTDNMIAAALLHDVVEDCPGYTFEIIADKVSPKVAELVRGMTEASKPEDGNRATRKEIDKNFLAEQSAEVQTIKYADVISNSKDIRAYDPKFAEVYFREIKALLEVMDKGDPALYSKAIEAVNQN